MGDGLGGVPRKPRWACRTVGVRPLPAETGDEPGCNGDAAGDARG